MASKDVQRLIGALQVVGGAVEAFYGGGSGGGYLIGSGVENLSGSKKGSAHVLTGRNFLGDVEGMATGSGPSQGGRYGALAGGLLGGYEGFGGGAGGSGSWSGFSLGAGNKGAGIPGFASTGQTSTTGTPSTSASGLGSLSSFANILQGLNTSNQQQQAPPITQPTPALTAVPQILMPQAQDPLQLAIANLLAQRIR